VVAVDPDQLLGLAFLKGFNILVREELLRAVLRYQTTRVSFGTSVAAVVSGLALTALMPRLSRNSIAGSSASIVLTCCTHMRVKAQYETP
jgi:hypothetical protein